METEKEMGIVEIFGLNASGLNTVMSFIDEELEKGSRCGVTYPMTDCADGVVSVGLKSLSKQDLCKLSGRGFRFRMG